MKIRKNGENGQKIRKEINLTLHNAGLHITLPFDAPNPGCKFVPLHETSQRGLYPKI